MADKNFEKESNMKFIAKEGCEPEPELLEWIEDNFDEIFHINECAKFVEDYFNMEEKIK